MSQPQRHYTLDDCFAVEETSAIRHEFLNGEIFAMAGASLNHNHVAATRDYDRGDKLAAYRIIPSLRAALLVDQAIVSVEHWRRENESSWTSSTTTDLAATLTLTAVAVELPLREIYREVFA